MTGTWDGDSYQQRFDDLASSGEHVHGEADFVRSYGPSTVLDAGCGTGRVAIELARHGVDVVGLDRDPAMLATARERGPGVEWVEADLCDAHLDHEFDVVLMAGNVPLFTPPGSQADLVAGAARHLTVGGLFVAGFSTDWDERAYDADTHERLCRHAGLRPVERYATWERDPWTERSTYAVCVSMRPETST